MSVKRFISKDAHSAMQQVRKEFGDDAVIVANRETAEGVEIIAANSFDDLLDPDTIEDAVAETEDSVEEAPDDDTPAEKPKTKAPKAGRKKTTVAKGAPSPTAKPAAAKPAVTAAAPTAAANTEFQREIVELRSMLEGLARSGSISTTKNASQIGLSGRLMAAGFGAELVRDLMESVSAIKKPDNAWRKITSILEKQIPVDSTDFIADGGIVFFHGPAGAGKTTALCKVASQFLARESASKLALINCDTRAIGNSGLLPAVGSLLGVPIHNATTEADLTHATRQLRRKHLILIDTNALTLESARSPEQLTGIKHSSKRTKHCLVLPANLQASALDGILGCLSESLVQSLILSKTDESTQLGIAIDSLLRSSMKLAFLCDSPRLHDPLHPADTADLIARTLNTQNIVLPTIINKMPGQSNNGSTISEDSLSSIPFG